VNQSDAFSASKKSNTCWYIYHCTNTLRPSDFFVYGCHRRLNKVAYVTEDDILDAEQLVEATLSRDISSAFDECRRCITVTNWRLKIIGNEDGHLETTSYAIQYESKRY
jgi:hypothetical protein